MVIDEIVLSIRSITRSSLLITADLQDSLKVDLNHLDFAEKTFIEAKNHWMIGIRRLFYSIPTFMWSVKSFFFILATKLNTFYLITIHDVKLF